MKRFYFLASLITSFVAIYYLSVLNYRSFIVAINNFTLLLFLYSRKSFIKEILFYFIFTIVFFETFIFSYHLFTNIDPTLLTKFFNSSSNLSEAIYRFKGSEIFGIDFNLIAALFAVFSLLFKQINKKSLSILFFVFCLLTFSRSTLLLLSIFLFLPTKKINLKLFLPILITAMIFFINYDGNLTDITIKNKTYFLFFDVLVNSPSQLLVGDPNINFAILNDLVKGDSNIGHTLPGSLVSFGIIYLLPSLSILLILWRRHILLRLPILFIITYSLFSVVAFNITNPLFVLFSAINKDIKENKS